MSLLIAVHLTAAILLATYGLHRLLLTARFLRARRDPSRAEPSPTALPLVTVQIPLYNERYVAERAILAAGALEYPSDRLEIQVLDDSTDETDTAAARAVAALRARGLRVHHLRRPRRVGFKAGALAAGLRRARGELVAIFDADFVPTPDFLRRVVGEFRDPAVGLVQARWGHINRDSSPLTRAQALQLDAHFTIEHGVRAMTGCFFNFNGTAGIWRREAIESSGGWRAATLTEDLDLSYRAQLAGWRFVYRDDVEVPAELPVEITAYRIQQDRWAQGGAQTARLMLPTVFRTRQAWRVKWEAFWHLTAHFTYPLLVILASAGLAAGWLGEAGYPGWMLLADAGLLGFAMIALTIFYGVTARTRHPDRWWRDLALVPVIMVLGAGIALRQTAAVARGLTRRDTPFQRTPKYRLGPAPDTSWRSAAYRILASRAAALECLLGVGVLTAASVTMALGTGTPTGPAMLFGVGAVVVGGGTLAQHRRPAPPAPTGRERYTDPTRRKTA